MATPNLNVEFDAVSDVKGKFARLAKLLGLADADHARGKCEHLWMACTTRGEIDLPRWLIEQHLGERGPDALVMAELARWAGGRGDSDTRRLRMSGARKHCTWMAANSEQSSKAGKANARTANRVDGKFARKPTIPNHPSDPPIDPPIPEDQNLPSARAIPPSTEPSTTPTPAHGIGPTLDELWSELEAARQRVSTALGMTLQPLVAHDPGRADLAAALVDATSKGKRAELAAQVRHAIAVAASEAETDHEQLRWFTGAIFSPRNFRRLAAAPSPKSKPARKPPAFAPRPNPIPAAELAGANELAEAWKALGINATEEP